MFDVECASSSGIIVSSIKSPLLCYRNIFPPFFFAGMPLKCQFILSLCIWIWFAYLFILFRVLPPFPKGVRGDWIEIDRCWWTNAFLSLSAVVCKRQPLFALKITDPLSENGYPWVLEWISYTDRDNWPLSSRVCNQLSLHQVNGRESV